MLSNRWVRRGQQVIGGLVTAALLVIVVVLGLAVVPSFAGFETLNILSGSMEPGIPTGSLVLAEVIDAEDIDVGDVVLAQRNTSSGAPPVLHRVIERRAVPGGVEVRTQGDNNDRPDAGLHTFHDRTATPVWVIPQLGQLHTEITTPRGWLAFVVIPASAVCAVSLLQLWWPKPEDDDATAAAAAGAVT